jgi:Mg/Co/Ni transporter MgtE
LPSEGSNANRHKIGDVVRQITSCSPHELIGEIKQRLQETPFCAVVDSNNVVLGLLHGDAWGVDDNTRAEDVMSLAPITFRPNRAIEQAKEYFSSHDIETSLVTNPDGKLIGMAFRSDIEKLASKGDRAA